MIYPFLPVFGRGLGVDLNSLSKAMAVRSASGVLGPLLASIGDLRGRRMGLLLGLALFILANGLIFVLPTLPIFVLALILNLLAYFTFNPTMQAYLGDKVAYQERGRALALPELGWSLSFIIGVPLMGLVISHYGWRAPFPLLAGAGIIAFIVIAIIIPTEQVHHGLRPGIWRIFRLVLTSPPVLAGMLLGGTAAMANELVTLIFGIWLEDAFAVEIAALGITAAVIGFAELGGKLASAGLVDRIGKPRAVASGIILNSLVALGMAILGLNLTGALAALFLFYLTFEFTIVCSIPIITEILPQARATVMAVTVAFMALGRAAGDILSPRLYDLGQDQAQASDLLAVGIGVIALNFIALLALRYLAHIIQKSSPETVTG